MKNLKRIFSLLLVFCMMLSTSVVYVSADAVYEFSDVDTGDKYAEAITLLSAIGIIRGYEDGKFHPELNITRAEAATIIVRTLGLDENVQKGETIFSDVERSHWASGYINIAVENGIINGFPEGTFLPEDYVTYEQIVKMVVCAIGHNLKADSLGGYPDGFIRAASDARITKGIAGMGKNPAPRGLVAQLIYNALEVEMMDATSFSTGVLGTSYGYNGETLLNDYLGIEKVEAVVTDTYLTGETFSNRDKFITMDITKVYSLSNRASSPLYDKGDEVDFDEGEVNTATSYLGKAVVAYVGEDEDSRKDTLFAIAIDDSRNEEVEVTKERFFAEESNENVISYTKRSTDRRVTELELDRYVEIVVNGEIVSESITEYFDTFDVLTLIDNNRDNEYDFVFVDVFDESEGVEFVVEEIEEDDEYYYFEGEDGELELDYSDDDTHIVIIKDGEEIEPDDIDKGDTITCLDTSRSIIKVYVSDEKVKGYIEEVDYNEGEYYINEKPYELSSAFAEELSAGDAGTFYLNYKGKIAYTTVTSRVSGGDYVFITNYDTKTKFSKTTYLLQVISEDNVEETYTLKASKMKYIDHNGNVFKNVTPREVYDYLTFNKTDLSDMFSINGYVGIAKIKASSAGVISEIYIPGTYEEFYAQTKYATENSKEYSEERGRYGNYDISGKEVAFRIDDNEADITDAVEAGTVREFFTDGDNYSFIAYGERSKDIEAIVITDGISAANYQNHAVIVTNVSTFHIGNNENTTKITGRQGTTTVTYLIDPDESYDVEVGNIILVSENAKGYVSRLEKVANTTEDAEDLYSAFIGVDIPGDEDAGVYGGMVSDKGKKSFEIEGIDESFYNDSTTAYHLIDYTLRETTITKGSFSDIKTTKQTDTFAIVRTYEDDAIDVFIFRVDAGEVDVDSTDIWDNIISADPEEPTEAPTETPSEPETEATEPTTEPVTEPVTAPTTEPTTEPVTEPVTTPVTEPTTEPVTEPVTAPTTEPTTEPVTEPVTTPTTEPTTEPVTEPVTAPVTEPTTEPVTEPVTAPVTEPVTAPVTEPTTEPVTEPVTTPVTEPTTEPVTEPVTQGPTVAVTEPTTEDGPILAELATSVPEVKKVEVDLKQAEEVLKLINAERTKANLPVLVWDKSVAAVSQAHGIDMATNKYLDQKNKAGADVAKRLTNAKVVFTAAAENLAQGKYTPAVIVNAWMNSEKHKANILNKDFTKVGICVATAIDGTVYWVVDFVK